MSNRIFNKNRKEEKIIKILEFDNVDLNIYCQTSDLHLASIYCWWFINNPIILHSEKYIINI